ncbi:PEP-CTERM sorting domain-containing protein [Roseateles sp.]|uniref:PEP-CTERM sorting domain-containing protein n=1 Tax=Roseateles sp. TaxID=1971397 RepID=UPI0039E97BCB
MKSLTAALATVLLTATPLAAQAQSGNLAVDAQANIFGYGVGTPAPGGGGGGVLAPVIALNAGTGRTITFAASGIAGWGGSLNNGPDGGLFSGSTQIPAVGPISGYSGPLSGFLVGVFIEAGDISGLAAPGGLSYAGTADYAQASYAPNLRQVFFIGDGLTGTGAGAPQVFHIPDGAGALVLGIADAYGFNAAAGYYYDNVGSFDVMYQAVPEPASSALFGLGAAALIAAAARRRRKG